MKHVLVFWALLLAGTTGAKAVGALVEMNIFHSTRTEL
jgi:hypothetical protein